MNSGGKGRKLSDPMPAIPHNAAVFPPSAVLRLLRQKRQRFGKHRSGSFVFKTEESLIIGKKPDSPDFSLPGDERFIIAILGQEVGYALSCAGFFREVVFILFPETGQEIGLPYGLSGNCRLRPSPVR